MFKTLDATKRSGKVTVLLNKFGKKIVSQQDAKDQLVRLMELYQSGLYDKTKPIGALLFLGPTGSGKTRTAEAFVEGLFGHASKMMKVDCGEFQHSHEIAKLQGSPPGYLGHRETHPYFTNASLLAARSDKDGREILPFTVCLWDEIEKASDSLWNLLLGILDKGVMTTGMNERVDFLPTIHILTSNIGVSELNAPEQAVGFRGEQIEVTDEEIKTIVTAAARKKFSPEFLNRLTGMVCFKTLTRDDIAQVLDITLNEVQERIVLGSGVPLFEIRVSNNAMKKLLDAGYDRRYNARNLKREVEANLVEPLARLVNTKQVDDGDILVIDYTDSGWRYMTVGTMNNAAAAETIIPSRIQP
jgi:ATP-dependent Clp protease ATP-binding subunit ClpB